VRAFRGSNSGGNMCILPRCIAVDVVQFQLVAIRCRNSMKEAIGSIPQAKFKLRCPDGDSKRFQRPVSEKGRASRNKAVSGSISPIGSSCQTKSKPRDRDTQRCVMVVVARDGIVLSMGLAIL